MSTLLTRATSAPAPAQPASLSEARSSLIALEFSLESAERRESSLDKIDTLLRVLHRFRAGLEAEAELDALPELDAGTLQRTFDVARLAL
jgi:hypothetical protein